MATDPLLAWIRKMQTSADYLPMDSLQAGMAYAIFARNAYVGIWIPEQSGFLISRYKVGPTPYLFVEYHWDTGEPHGTAKPLRLLEACPFPLPNREHYRDEDANAAACVWLDELEARNPPMPGWDSVGDRRGSKGA